MGVSFALANRVISWAVGTWSEIAREVMAAAGGDRRLPLHKCPLTSWLPGKSITGTALATSWSAGACAEVVTWLFPLWCHHHSLGHLGRLRQWWWLQWQQWSGGRDGPNHYELVHFPGSSWWFMARG